MIQVAKDERVNTPPTLAFAVRREDPELVGPASQTPRETKTLSDLDNIDILRSCVSLALFYRRRRGEDGVHPAGVIRDALGEALVHYYPLAGRLREIEGGKLVVDCTGEGVLLVQADADVQLVDLEAAGHGLKPPFPCWDQLLFDVQEGGVLNTPLLLIQVTRLQCGGFVLALRFSHPICDGIGIGQFLNAVGELARGLPSMTVTPVWSRELIKAGGAGRDMARLRRELEVPPPASDDGMVTRTFTFSASDVTKMKKNLGTGDVTATTFEALVAFLWRARTSALELAPGEDAPLAIAVNSRGAGVLGLPVGYYGNAAVVSKAVVGSGALCRGSLGDAVALVRLAKAAVTAEYVRSRVDEMVLLGTGRTTLDPNFWFGVSDTRRLGLDGVDMGWGQPVFAGLAGPFVFGMSYLIAVKNGDGEEDAVCVPVVLPHHAMLRFAAEVTARLAQLYLPSEI